MREITDEYEIEQMKQEKYENSYHEQIQNKDYDYSPDGDIEYCDCGRPLNSHGWCYRCQG